MGYIKNKKLSKGEIEDQVGSYEKSDPKDVLKSGREAGEKGREKIKAKKKDK